MSGPDIVVVGAGPTGLALALQAHDHGARVRVVERRAEPFRPSRALIVHPRTLEVLRPLGVTDCLLASGEIAPSAHLHLGRREIPVRLGDFDLPDTPSPYLLFVRQAVVEAVLSAALADRGVNVERGVELVDLHRGTDDAEVMLSRKGGTETVGCTYVAGCDGAASTVRRLAGVDWRGGSYAQEIVLADVEIDGDLTPAAAHAFAGRDGVLFLFASGERATWRLLATRAAGDGQGRARPQVDTVPLHQLQSLLDSARVPARVSVAAWSSRIPLQHRLASRYRVGPLLLAGDAAHVHSPAGGQGMNTGIQDALNLGWKLAFASNSRYRPKNDGLVDSYERERRPVARRVLALTHGLFWAEAGMGPLARLARGSLTPLAAPLVPYLLRRRRLVAEGVRLLSQLQVTYRHSELSVENTPPGCRGPRPGERLPDAAVTVAGGHCRLHALLAHPGLHMLLDRDAAVPDLEVLMPMVTVHRLLDRSGTGVRVVRPDGFIGYRSASMDPAHLRSWLTLLGVSPQPSAVR